MGSGHTKIHSVDNQDKNVMDEYTTREMQAKLFNAIRQQKFKLARILADGGVNVNCSLRTGITPLMMACDQRVDNEREKMHKHMIRALLVNNADVNAKDILGRTCLEYAALTGDIQLVRLLEMHASASTEGQTIASSHGGPRHRHSVGISSNMDMDFHIWELVDFQDVII